MATHKYWPLTPWSGSEGMMHSAMTSRILVPSSSQLWLASRAPKGLSSTCSDTYLIMWSLASEFTGCLLFSDCYHLPNKSYMSEELITSYLWPTQFWFTNVGLNKAILPIMLLFMSLWRGIFIQTTTFGEEYNNKGLWVSRLLSGCSCFSEKPEPSSLRWIQVTGTCRIWADGCRKY